MSTFAKYQQRGAYHWRAFERSPVRLDLFTRSRYQAVLDAASVKDGEIVVDLGCGDGALTGMLAKVNQSGRTIGVEPEPVGRGLAQQETTRRGIRAEFIENSSALDDRSANLVVSAEVIEHVSAPDEMVQEIKRILRIGGRVVMTTPVRLTEEPYDHEHVREFYPSEFAALMHPHFEVLSHDFRFPVMATGLYGWCPPIFLKRGVIRVAANALFLATGWNLLERVSPGNPFWMTQIIVGMRQS